MKYRLISFLSISIVAITGYVVFTHYTYATSTADFSAGNIISDGVFTNTTTMTAQQVQGFLNSKVASCDTNGTLAATEYGSSLTHAQYAASRGWSAPPYTCLKDYTENGLSAAQIIYNIAQQYKINPQALIVLLQKEQGLVTDTWPLASQYKTATGYGCPDTAACDSQYFGLTNQLHWSGTMFRAILDNNPNWYTPYVLGNNYVKWHPDFAVYNAQGVFQRWEDRCGGTTVNIQNRSTQALYNYTPYQPNQASLNAGYGTGDSCSSYGNRNFYLYFTDWFGPTHKTLIPGCAEATNTSLSCAWKVKDNNTGREIISISYSQVDDFVNNQSGYSFMGKSFLVRNPVAPRSGNIPIYSVTLSGTPFLTADKNEYQSLVSAGNQDNGTAFYADPSGSNSGYPVYRLNSAAYGHVWTSDTVAVASYISQGYTNEGVAFTALSPYAQEVAPLAGQSLVYRFGSMPGNTHFWTTDIAERDGMIAVGYRYEGVGWKASQYTTTTPVYRLYSNNMQKHLYTTDSYEKDVLTATGVWSYEGIGWYESPAATANPVYRLYSPTTYEHFFTTDAYERSQLVSRNVFNDEGVAWYQP